MLQQDNRKDLLCDKCIHNDVCKYKKQFIATWNSYEPIADKSDILIINISCKYFSNKYQGITQRGIGDDNINITPVSTNQYPNSCLECDFYKNYLQSGKIYVGDSPCQWCPSYPYKLTCSSSDINSYNLTTGSCANNKTILNESVNNDNNKESK